MSLFLQSFQFVRIFEYMEAAISVYLNVGQLNVVRASLNVLRRILVMERNNPAGRSDGLWGWI